MPGLTMLINVRGVLLSIFYDTLSYLPFYLPFNMS